MLLDNLNKIRFRIEAAAQRSGRDPGKVSLVVVTKKAPLASVVELLDSGLVQDIGENRTQDAAARKRELGALARKARWHMLGHLQSNKAREALATFDTVDSVDSLKLGGVLEKTLPAEAAPLPVLVQVKLSDREEQSGVAPEGLGGFLEQLKAFPRLTVGGLMAIAPNLEPLEAVRPYFRRMRGLFEEFFSSDPQARLSMGMSRDFELAVEEGATQIRVGTSIFSDSE